MKLKDYQQIMIERIKEQQDALPDPVPEGEATAEDYQAALLELGVNLNMGSEVDEDAEE